MSGLGGILALLPVITAGFLFNVVWYRTRYITAGAEGQRLFFLCAASGFVIAAVAFPLYREFIPNRINEFVECYYPGSHVGELMLALVLAPVAASLVNLRYWVPISIKQRSLLKGGAWEYAYSKLSARYGNPIQKLLVSATESRQLVLLTLTSRKVYCGIIARMPINFQSDDLFVEIIPKFSATRDKDSLQLDNKLEYQAFHIWTQKMRISSLEDVAEKVKAQIKKSGDAAMSEEAMDPLRSLAHSYSEKIATLQARLGQIATSDYLAKFDIQKWAKVVPASQIESASIFDDSAPESWFTQAAKPNHPIAPARTTASAQ